MGSETEQSFEMTGIKWSESMVVDWNQGVRIHGSRLELNDMYGV